MSKLGSELEYWPKLAKLGSKMAKLQFKFGKMGSKIAEAAKLGKKWSN